jgi:hypothetical protein
MCCSLPTDHHKCEPKIEINGCHNILCCVTFPTTEHNLHFLRNGGSNMCAINSPNYKQHYIKRATTLK